MNRLLKIILWILGLRLLISGLDAFVRGDQAAGAFLLVLALLVLPPGFSFVMKILGGGMSQENYGSYNKHEGRYNKNQKSILGLLPPEKKHAITNQPPAETQDYTIFSTKKRPGLKQ